MKTVPQKAKKIKRILELENLSFIADKPIIDSITWNVDEGQRWVLFHVVRIQHAVVRPNVR